MTRLRVGYLALAFLMGWGLVLGAAAQEASPVAGARTEPPPEVLGHRHTQSGVRRGEARNAHARLMAEQDSRCHSRSNSVTLPAGTVT